MAVSMNGMHYWKQYNFPAVHHCWLMSCTLINVIEPGFSGGFNWFLTRQVIPITECVVCQHGSLMYLLSAEETSEPYQKSVRTVELLQHCFW